MDTNKPSMAVIVGQGGDHFIQPILADLSADYSIVPISGGLRRVWMESADVIWCEWADAAGASQQYIAGLKGKRIVCRVHSYEVFEPWFAQIDWSVFTDVIFVADHVRQYAVRHAKMSDVQTHVIFNGIKLADYPFQTFSEGRPHKILVYGSINHKKGVQFALQTFYQFQAWADAGDWELHFTGEVQDSRYMEYLSHQSKLLRIADRVFYHPPAPPQEAFAGMGYVGVFSPWEGCPVGVLEGIASGCFPLIHNFPGATEMYGVTAPFVWATQYHFGRVALDGPEDFGQWLAILTDRFQFDRMALDVRSVLSGKSLQTTVRARAGCPVPGPLLDCIDV